MNDPRSKARPEGTRALTVTWAALVVLSLGSYFLAEGDGVGPAVVLVLVFVKLLLVLAIFMELARHGRSWLLPIGACLALVVGMIAVVFES
ncbi:MAG: cytochrome C oxidase subunit IV family protein [Planctomycetota bacterium]|nr:cytochrome C oxidase subunit IV family protein [Planctomycetota bacterium]